MASTNDKSVSLSILVDTLGQENVDRLAAALRNVGTQGAESKEDTDLLVQTLGDLTEKSTAANLAANSLTKAHQAARSAYSRSREEITLLKATTDDATKGTTAYKDSIRALSIESVRMRTAQREANEARQKAVTTAMVAGSQEKALREEIQRTTAAATASATASHTQAQGHTNVADAAHGAIEQLERMERAVTAIASGAVVGHFGSELAHTADEFKNLESRIRIAVGASGDVQGAMKGIFQVAQSTGQSVETVGCPRRLNFEPPCRLNFEPGAEANF